MANPVPNKIQKLDNLVQINKVAGGVHVPAGATVVIAGAAAKSDVPFLAPYSPRGYQVVVRESLLNKVKVPLLAGISQSLVVLPGVGKTTLALQLASDEEILQRYPDGVLWAHLGPQPEILAELKKWALALDIPVAQMAALASEAEWQSAVAEAIGLRRMLLVVDDVWGAPAAQPFLTGKNCAHLITTRKRGVAVDLLGEPVVVEKLSDSEGLTLLRGLAPKAVKGNEDAAAKLVRAVDGLPLALVLMGKYLRHTEVMSSYRIPEALKKLGDAKERFRLQQPAERPGEAPLSLSAAIEIGYDALSADAREALKRLAIFRPAPHVFAKDLALSVSGAASETLDELNEAGLIENRDAEPPTGQPCYTMDQTIAEYLRGMLSADVSKQLHHDAAAYCWRQMKSLEEKYQRDPGAQDYSGWYRYENPQWQGQKDSWLYHLSQAGDASAETLSAFLRAYFDAFWWWGCFLEFRFCNQLIKEWQQRQSSAESLRMLDLVKEFQDLYPKETETGRAGNWSRVEEVLKELRRLIGIDGDAAALTQPEHRHVRGLTDIFLAEVARFGGNDRERAAQWYDEAYVLFDRNGDDWDKAWVLFHAADSNHERGRDEEALQQADASLQLGRSKRDPEVLALACRLQGDIFLAQGKLPRALEQYQRALFHAYRFQSDPANPDAYTVTFYSQMVARILARMEKLSASEQSVASLLMHDFWPPEAGLANAQAAACNAEAWKAFLFPRELDPQELAAHGSDYGKTVSRVVQALGQRPGLD